MNVVNLVGRTARNLDLQRTPSGVSIIKTVIAVDRGGKDRGTDFIPITVFGMTADNMFRFVKKGDRIGVEGHIRIESKETPDGRRTYTDIIAEKVEFLGGGAKAEPRYDTPENRYDAPVTAAQLPQQLNQAQDEEDIVPDDLPF